MVHELLWFLKGDTNTKYLNDNGVKIWDEWADENGDLGPVYGKQWVEWSSTKRKMTKIGEHPEHGDIFAMVNVKINQIQNVIDTLKTNPDSRRMIVSAWNVGALDEMALEPCHAFFQFYTEELSFDDRSKLLDKVYGIKKPEDRVTPWLVENLDESNIPKRRLSLQLYQRSSDVFLGVPFNIASYSLLLQMIAQCVNMVPGEFIWSGGDCHLYDNHKEQVGELLKREPKVLPTVKLNPHIKDIFEFTSEDIKLEGYDPHPLIKGKVAV